MTAIVDSDQHLYESRSLWVDHIDPGLRDEALTIDRRRSRVSVADMA